MSQILRLQKKSYEDIEPGTRNVIWTDYTKLPLENKYKQLQYKILHGIVPCRKFVFKINVVQSINCPIYDEEENIDHYFVKCSRLIVFWEQFFKWLAPVYLVSDELNKTNFYNNMLLNNLKNYRCSRVLSIISLVAKFYIYKCKVLEKTISFRNFKAEFTQFCDIFQRLNYTCKAEIMKSFIVLK